MPGLKGRLASVQNLLAWRRDFLALLRDFDRRYSGPKMSPVYFDMIGQRMCLITDPRHIKQYFSNYEIFTRNVTNLHAFRVALGRNIVTAPDKEWPTVRKRTAGYFTNKNLERYGDAVVEVLERLAVPKLTKKAATGEPVELFEDMLEIGSIASFRSFLGQGSEDPPREVYLALNDLFCYVRAKTFSFLVLPRWVPTDENRALNRNRAILREYLRPRLTLDRDKDTMMGDIIRNYTDGQGRVDADRVLDETIANLLGGSETTIILMAFVIYYLVQYPEVAEKLRAEVDAVLGGRAPAVRDLKNMPYLLQIVQETLRLRSPGYVNYRYTLRDAELCGHAMPEGTWIFASQYITHQDPRVWNAPHIFRPERFAQDSPEAPWNRKDEIPFFPFGGGIFFCLGKNFAVNEAALLVAVLYQHFKFSIPGERARFPDPGIDARLTLRPGSPIRVAVHPRA